MIDFHCHLDLYQDPVRVARACAKRDMQVLSVTTTPMAWEYSKNFLGGMSVRPALGLHPQIAHLRKHELELFEEILPDTDFVGEVGLDGGHGYREYWRDQLDVFRQILRFCTRVGGRILSIHSRQASRAVLDCLEDFPNAGIPILHWFSGTLRELDRAIGLGCYFSVGPAMTKGQRGRALVGRMPVDRVLTESDGPFVSFAGRPLLPWEAERAVGHLREIWGEHKCGVITKLNQNLDHLMHSLPRAVTVNPRIP